MDEGTLPDRKARLLLKLPFWLVRECTSIMRKVENYKASVPSN